MALKTRNPTGNRTLATLSIRLTLFTPSCFEPLDAVGCPIMAHLPIVRMWWERRWLRGFGANIDQKRGDTCRLVAVDGKMASGACTLEGRDLRVSSLPGSRLL